MESFRPQDMRAEQELAKFMDENFYDRLTLKPGHEGQTISHERIQDKGTQLQGIDVILTVGEKRYLIDEKASLYYSNVMIPTFAFEISFFNPSSNSISEGWFVKNGQQTEYYMLIWPNVKCVQKGTDKAWVRKDIKHLEKTDFTIVEAMLVKKSSVIEYFAKKDWSISRIVGYADQFRKRCNNASEKKSEVLSAEPDENDPVKIEYSGMLAEKPINLVLRKNVLKEMASGVYLISADGYAEIS